MEIRVLRYFLMVAREGNITKAAKNLHITQPTLSRQMMQLEEDLGKQLFIRTKGRLGLTDEGMLLKRRAEEIVDLVNKTEQEFSEQESLITGEVFIGAGETQGMQVLAKIMKDFTNDYPQVKYNLYSGTADDVQERIDRGLIDIGLLVEPVDTDKYEVVKLPKKDKMGVVIPKDSPLAQQDFVTPKDLLDKPLMISKRLLVQKQVANWFGADYDKLKIVAHYNLIYNAAIMVEARIGYAICLEKLVTANEETNVCFKPFYPELETGMVLVWKKHQVFSPATTKFIERIKHALKA